MEKEKKCEYYLGLDIGTDSVGYAAADRRYRLLRFKGEPVWGVTLFDEAQQCAERRGFRTTRRRLERRRQRIILLQELFAEEIAKTDAHFYTRIRESALLAEDKSVPGDLNALFNDAGFRDKEYHAKYPTVHHLIVDLIENPEGKDIRLLYIACAWLIAHRGHFLSEINCDNLGALTDMTGLYRRFSEWFAENELDLPWQIDGKSFASVMCQKCRISEKSRNFMTCCLEAKSRRMTRTKRYPKQAC